MSGCVMKLLTLTSLFAAITFCGAITVGLHSGFVGGLIGLAVGITLASAFYFGAFVYLTFAVRVGEALWPGISDLSDSSKKPPFIGLVVGWIMVLIYLAWFIVCCGSAVWLTSFLIRFCRSA